MLRRAHRNAVTQTGRAPLSERGHDFYETPAAAVHALLRAEKLPKNIWEPACGRGAIAEVLRKSGHRVYATDLVNYHSAIQDRAGCDFLRGGAAPFTVGAIVTNPPFKFANHFVARALTLSPKVIMLLRVAFLEGVGRSTILEGGSLARVHVFRNRLPRMHRDGWKGRKSTSSIAFAWFVWDRHWSGPTQLHRISWEQP